MKKLNKVTTEVYKRLKSLAADLPKIQRANEKGEPLFVFRTDVRSSTYIPSKTKKGWGRREADTMTKKVPLLANHEVALIEAWKVSGENGVQYYLNLIKKVAAETAPKEEKEADPV